MTNRMTQWSLSMSQLPGADSDHDQYLTKGLSNSLINLVF